MNLTAAPQSLDTTFLFRRDELKALYAAVRERGCAKRQLGSREKVPAWLANTEMYLRCLQPPAEAFRIHDIVCNL
jgi:hypothetical protein